MEDHARRQVTTVAFSVQSLMINLMSNSGSPRKKGVSPWFPVVSLFLIILVLTTLFSAFFAGGQGLDALSFAVALISVLFRLFVVALILAPLFLAVLSICFGYAILIKKKQKNPQPSGSGTRNAIKRFEVD